MENTRLNWEKHGYEAWGGNPPLIEYEAEIGKDKNGTVWLCRVKYRPAEKKFMVLFDTDAYTDDGCPFLRSSVVYADDFWGAMRKRYFMKKVDYDKIESTVRWFMEDNDIKA